MNRNHPIYTERLSAAEVAAHFGVTNPIDTNAGGGDVYPGGPGIVVREKNNARIVETMTWGFPRPMKSKVTGQPIKPKPVNNIADLTNFMWRHIAPKPENRCLIPLTDFAEAEGEKGSMTRVWFSVKDSPIVAWAGMWRSSEEWGAVYSGLMTDCNAAIRPFHNRMPVLLHADEHERWLHGSLEDVEAFRDRCFPDELIVIDRTDTPWAARRASPTGGLAFG